MRYVLAETYADAAHFATKRMFSPESWCFVSSVRILRRTRAPLVWCVGHWRRRPDAGELAAEMVARRASRLDADV